MRFAEKVMDFAKSSERCSELLNFFYTKMFTGKNQLKIVSAEAATT